MASKKSSKNRERARRAGAFVARGWKGTAFEALAGGASFHLIGKLSEASETVRDRWYVAPLVTIAAGHFIKRKGKLAGIGAALIGAGGHAFELNRALVKQSEEQGGGGQTAETQGVVHGNAPAFLPAHGNVVPFPSAQAPEPAAADVSAVMGLGRRNRYR